MDSAATSAAVSPPANRPLTANFPEHERAYILIAIGIARERLDCKPNDQRVTNNLCDEVRRILGEPRFLGLVRRVSSTQPSNPSIRAMWQALTQKGKISKPKNNNGPKKNEEVRERVRAARAKLGEYSIRQLAREAKVSRSTAFDLVKEARQNAFVRPRG